MKHFILLLSFIVTHTTSAPLMLTPLIKAGQYDKAKTLSRVSIDNETLGYSAYITVPSRSPEQNNNVYFWLQPCTKCTPSTAPFILWMQGGPGGPGTFGALQEIGNWYPDKNMNLKHRCFSWCETHNCLFVDQPTMTGFSFPTNVSTGKFDRDHIIYTRTSAEATEQIYQVIQQVFTLFPEYQPAPFYVTGESYGGLYCANMGYTILQHNKLDKDIEINLQGVLVADPVINNKYQFPTYASTLHAMGVILSSEQKMLADLFSRSLKAMETSCTAGFKLWNSVWNDDGGGGAPGLFYELTGSSMTENVLLSKSPDAFGRPEKFFKPLHIRKAFHFDGVPASSSSEGGLVYSTMVESGDFCSNSSWLYATLFSSGIDVMIYSSTSDPLLGPPTTEAGVRSIFDYAATQPGGAEEKEAYKAAKKVTWKVEKTDKTIAGYSKCFTNKHDAQFCYNVIRNAGHESPAFQPRSNYDMLLRFIQHRSFTEDGDDPSQIPVCAPCGGVPPFAGSALPECQ